MNYEVFTCAFVLLVGGYFIGRVIEKQRTEDQLKLWREKVLTSVSKLLLAIRNGSSSIRVYDDTVRDTSEGGAVVHFRAVPMELFLLMSEMGKTCQPEHEVVELMKRLEEIENGHMPDGGLQSWKELHGWTEDLKTKHSMLSTAEPEKKWLKRFFPNSTAIDQMLQSSLIGVLKNQYCYPLKDRTRNVAKIRELLSVYGIELPAEDNDLERAVFNTAML